MSDATPTRTRSGSPVGPPSKHQLALMIWSPSSRP